MYALERGNWQRAVPVSQRQPEVKLTETRSSSVWFIITSWRSQPSQRTTSPSCGGK